MKIVDYLYFWFFNFHTSKSKYTDDEILLCYKSFHASASVSLSLLLYLFTYSLFMVLAIINPILFEINIYIRVMVIPVIWILLLLFTTKHYKDKISILNERFRYNPLNTILKGWMIALFEIFLFVFPIIFGILLRLIKGEDFF